MRGRLIVLEGSDSSGKATQTNRLYERLISDKLQVKKIEYPNYNSNSSALVKMYLNGEFGTDPSDVNPYAASTFYAVDRFASFKTEWKDFYEAGGIVIADRYTTANMVHQAAKISDHCEKNSFLDWLWDLEFEKMGLPVPNCVIFLDMPPAYSEQLMKERNNKITGQEEKDIHEKNKEYLVSSYSNSKFIADKYNWCTISCVKDGLVKTIEEISEEIYNKVSDIL
ncbi:MAG: deoxynucleoside kinase [Bacillota bacterium]|nr:deoxynucleoside kinase [Bacillota bacterium]